MASTLEEDNERYSSATFAESTRQELTVPETLGTNGLLMPNCFAPAVIKGTKTSSIC